MFSVDRHRGFRWMRSFTGFVEGFDGGDLSLGLENMWAEREMRSEENGEE